MKQVYRSSRPVVFCKKDVLRSFAKFTGKHLCQRLFFNNVASQRRKACNFIKKEILEYVFSYEFCEISKNTFSDRVPPVATSWFSNILGLIMTKQLKNQKSVKASFQASIKGWCKEMATWKSWHWHSVSASILKYKNNLLRGIYISSLELKVISICFLKYVIFSKVASYKLEDCNFI